MKRITAYVKSFLLVLFVWIGALHECSAQSYFPDSFFSDWDYDRNQSLTHGEFYRGLSGTTFFEAWDINQDGSLVRQEFFDGLEQFQLYFSGKLPQEPLFQASVYKKKPGEKYSYFVSSPGNEILFRKADLNRNGKLNKAEFYTLIFRELDKDDSGTLSPSECTEFNAIRLFIQ